MQARHLRPLTVPLLRQVVQLPSLALLFTRISASLQIQRAHYSQLQQPGGGGDGAAPAERPPASGPLVGIKILDVGQVTSVAGLVHSSSFHVMMWACPAGAASRLHSMLAHPLTDHPL